ncbi:hypothetical protein DSM112329_01367 [Paraconexibacter sp. AEG42_29]|uniref:Uncharacterized protein n=1 Tax=Paraconexibacter sp. AEG42_29 TaxID=2997339 RepID=A0AAU7ASD8_9ACTN
MEPTRVGDLVTVAPGGPPLAGIVFDLPGSDKAVVAVVDATRGPSLRTVPLAIVTERPDAAGTDAALRALIRRTPAPGAVNARSGSGGAGRGSAAHGRVAKHRTTGK